MIFTYHKYKTIILYQQFIFTPNFYSFPDKEGQWSSTPHISTTAGVYNHRQGFPAAIGTVHRVAIIFCHKITHKKINNCTNNAF